MYMLKKNLYLFSLVNLVNSRVWLLFFITRLIWSPRTRVSSVVSASAGMTMTRRLIRNWNDYDASSNKKIKSDDVVCWLFMSKIILVGGASKNLNPSLRNIFIFTEQIKSEIMFIIAIHIFIKLILMFIMVYNIYYYILYQCNTSLHMIIIQVLVYDVFALFTIF